LIVGKNLYEGKVSRINEG